MDPKKLDDLDALYAFIRRHEEDLRVLRIIRPSEGALLETGLKEHSKAGYILAVLEQFIVQVSELEKFKS